MQVTHQPKVEATGSIGTEEKLETSGRVGAEEKLENKW